MADNFDQFELLLREFSPSGIRDLELKDDDIAWRLIAMMEPFTVGGVRQVVSGAYPSGYEARFRIKVQSGGRVTGANFGGNTQVMLGAGSHLASGQAADAVYPDPRLTPNRSYILIKMILKRFALSLTKNESQVRADLASDPVTTVAANEIEDIVTRLRSLITNNFYGDGTASMAQVNKAAGFTITETTQVEVDIDNGTWGRFMKGDILVAGSDADVRVQKAGNIAGQMVVVDLDNDDRTIKLQCRPGEGDIVLADNDHLMLAGMFDFTQSSNANASLACEGTESLLLQTGVFPGSISPTFSSGLNVDNFSELKSFIKDTTGTPVDPTMDAVTELLDKILDLDEEDAPDAFIAERSIWTLYSQLERENHATVLVPQATTFQGSGGVSAPMLSHNDKRFSVFNSKRIRQNSILGLAPSTWKKFIPLGDRTVRWKFGTGILSGFSSMFFPVTVGTQISELAQSVGDSFFQFGCFDPRKNFRRLGIRAQRDV